MYPLVAERLERIEQEQGIRVLFAAEAGSRAAGTQWEGSDFDVRFLYLRPREEYLRLDPLPDTLEYPQEEGWDLCGWDLRKALQQIHKGSPQLFEWFWSPVIYRDLDFSRRFVPLMEDWFQPWSAAQHYLGRLKTPMKYIPRDETLVVKHWLYAVQFALSVRWVLDSRTPPPVRYRELTEAMLPPEQASAVEQLLFWKTSGQLSLDRKPEESLKIWLERQTLEFPGRIKAMAADPQRGWEDLSRFFLEELEIQKM
jgi:predicted nucleotidyltransferase